MRYQRTFHCTNNLFIPWEGQEQTKVGTLRMLKCEVLQHAFILLNPSHSLYNVPFFFSNRVHFLLLVLWVHIFHWIVCLRCQAGLSHIQAVALCKGRQKAGTQQVCAVVILRAKIISI